MDPMDQTRQRLAKQTRIRTSEPQCPYCGAIVPRNTHGDAWFQWMNAHIDSRLHRWWWKLRNRGRRKDGKAHFG
jgi:hypothetical protein